jgi:DNA (cytosine-5)-methyltransferase 1
MTLTHLDLFSGIGGFALAARWAGLETIGFSEIDPYACRVLEKNFPGVPNYGDIHKITAGLIDGSPFLLTGGFPCQPYSVAGKRRGAADDRHLWPEMARLIAEVRPRWILGENVPGIVQMELDAVLSGLESVGYAVWPVVVPACAVDAIHRRDRVWVVAHTMPARQWRESWAEEMEEVALSNPVGLRGSQWMARSNRDEKRDTGKSYNDCSERDGERERAVVGTWFPEPELGRMVHGIPNRVDRLRGLGNAIVPQVAYELIRMILMAERAHQKQAQEAV